MKINVTEEDIKNGLPENIQCCAIALALAHEYKDQIDYVEVEDYDHIKMSNDTEDLWYRIHICPDDDVKVKKFIEDFDCGNKVKPFSFNINEIEEY